jgi:hypothetical protein
MDTNPVVLRRVMAGLRDQGYVQSEKGHGGVRRTWKGEALGDACGLEVFTPFTPGKSRP